MNNKIKNIANHLLDLGKRNRLLNYKDTGLKSVNILNKNCDEIFKNIVDSKSFSIFNIDPILAKYHKDLIINPEEDNVLNYSDLKVYDIISPLIKAKELICYKRGYSLVNTLKKLMKEYTFSIKEKGINSLYICFGYINYLEDNINYKAPLLLIPIEYTLEKNTYKIKEYEDEIILNPTLNYYLKTTFKITIPEYLDEEESLSDYFNRVKKSLHSNITLEAGMNIGIYSFLKMNMYEDLTSNTDIVLKNNNVRALLGEKYTYSEENLPTYPVVNCDSSQLAAISLAASGKSFCLQGPPGSGKSQTITNIISTLIANGKHVLFVSEKLAALEVVFENLKKAGLSDFAIELHSNKANKKEFIDNLYKTAILPKYDINSKASLEADKYEASKINLRNYQNELHQIDKKLGYSLYDLFSLYFNQKGIELSYKLNDIDNMDISILDQIIDKLNNYIYYSKYIGYNYKEMAFYGLKPLDMDYIRYSISNELKDAINYLLKLIEIKDDLLKYLDMKVISISDVINHLDFITNFINLKEFNNSYLSKDNRDNLILLLTKYLDIKNNTKTNLFKFYRNSILKEDIEALYISLKQKKGLFKAFNKNYRNAKTKILAYRNSKEKDKVILKELEELEAYKANLIKINRLSKKIEAIYGSLEGHNLKQILDDLKSIMMVNDINIKYDYNELKPKLTDLIIKFDIIKNDHCKLLKVNNLFDVTIYDLINSSIVNAYSKLKNIFSKIDQYDKYQLLYKNVNSLKEYNQIGYLDEYLKEGLPVDELSNSFKKLFYKQKIHSIIDKSPILNSFNSTEEDKITNLFRKLDEKILNINRDYIISVNSKKRPDDVLLEGSKFKILVKEKNKLRKQLPIRMLLEQIFELALDIKPIFLMSPLSVSTYLNNQENLFDCVIFDEASQIFASDAFGAIYRAKQCIIIGDNKQMPPSNFFNFSVEDEDDYDDSLESILDMATQSLATRSLKWHYRSRSEELISFSNNNFYDSSLITIPQAKEHRLGFGIDFIYLADGIYDVSSRTNIIEANYICDMVIKHYSESNQSLGVVAFSNVQARLIEDLIEKRIENMPELIEKMNSTEEPFFVKNLESVQGDERDRIIFSICYGYNKDQKFYQRFGPLNNLGGERRLNVAITRAKYNISVVSSIKSSDIRIENTESLGVKLLKDYLAFAENVSVNKNFIPTSDGVLCDVIRFLENEGFDCYPSFGASSFKIDLAIKKNDEFVMALMIDKKYSYSDSITDNERLEKLLLERLGWKYYKLYSTAWFNQNELEKEKLLNALNTDSIENKDVKAKSFLLESEKKDSLDDYFDSYKEVSIEDAKIILKNKGLDELIYSIIKIEQPISINYLYKKISKILDKTKVTNVVKNMVNQALNSDIINNNGFLSIDNSKVTLRINSLRLIEEISVDELKDGIYKIVSFNNGINIDGCYKALIKLLGYTRITDNTKEILDDALVYLKLEGKITQRNDCLFI